MRRRLFVLLLSVCWLVLVPAAAAERGALFRLAANGHTMYLFGTMHVGMDELYPLEPRITEAIEHASTLALELDPVQSRTALARAVQQYGMLPAGSDAYAALPPAERARIERVVRASGLDVGRAAGFKPVLLACILSLTEYIKLGYRPELSTDAFLARLAHASGVHVLELESAGQQLALLDRLTPVQQWRFLDETVGSIESGRQREQAQRVAQAWRMADRQALNQIAEGIAADRSVSGTFAREVMLLGRNPTLADKLAALLSREENTVAAIGVLHLLGEKSVPQLLRARGITVERIY
jgi:hypothetical protein